MQHAQLAVVFVGFGDLPRRPRHVAREEVAGDDHPDRPAGRVADDGAGADQFAAAVERFVRLRVGAATGNLRRQAVRRRAQVAGRQARCLQGDDRHDVRVHARGLQAVDLDHPDAPVHDRRRHGPLQRLDVAIEQQRRRHGRDERCRLRRHCRFTIAVERTGDAVGRAQHVGDRLAEPARGRLPDQLGPGRQDQQRRNDGQPEERGDELEAEAGERQAAPAFDRELDDITGQHEGEREQHRYVGDRQRVEHRFAEEVGIELRCPIGDADDDDEAGEEQQDPGENQPRVVAKRPPLHTAVRRRTARDRQRIGADGHGLLFWSSSISRVNSPTSRNWR